MDKNTEKINYFTPKVVYSSTQLKFSCFQMATQNTMVAGTRNGELIGFHLESNFSAKILIDIQKPLKTPIQKIECLVDCYNLLILSESVLYYYHLGGKKAKELEKNITSFDIKIEGKNMFLFTGYKNKVLKYAINSLVEEPDESKKNITLVKEYFFKANVKSCYILKNSLITSLTNNDVLFTNLTNLESRDSSLPKIENIILTKINNTEILALINYEKNNNVGIFLNELGNSSQSRNTLNLESRDKITRMVANNQFVILSTATSHYVYDLSDIRLVHTIKEEALTNFAYFDFYNDELYALSDNRVFMFVKLQLKEMVKQIKTTSFYRVGVSLLKTLMDETNKEVLEKTIEEVYFYCAWDYASKQRYEEATECFNQINYDPLEILSTFIDQYSLDVRFEFIAYTNQLKKFIKNLFTKKRGEIMNEKDDVIPSTKVKRKNPSKEDVKVSKWLEYIDYSLVRSMLELEEYYDLFDFMRKQDKLYCENKNNKIYPLLQVIENKVENDNLKIALKAEFSLLLKEDDKALEYLKKLVSKDSEAAKVDFKRYSHKRAIDILIKNHTSSQFMELLSSHFSWLILNIKQLSRLFDEMDFESKSVYNFLRHIEGLEDQNNKQALKELFLEKLFEKEVVEDKEINDQYFINELELYKSTKTVKYLEKALGFICNPKLWTNFKNCLVEFRRHKKYILANTEDLYVHAKCVQIETQLLKRIDTKESHQEALEMFLKLKEYAMAEQYCAEVNSSNSGDSYHSVNSEFLLNQLLEAYVDLYNKEKRNDKHLTLISDFLKKFSGNPNLDASRVIELLPDDFSLDNPHFDFFGFLDATLVELEAQEKMSQFRKHMAEAELNNINYQLAKHKARWIKIDDSSTCLKCGLKIKQKLFQVFPNGVVVDCSCMSQLKNKDSCPLTHQNFKKSNFV